MSAVEWVIITAVIAGVALGLATVIKTAVESRQTEIVTKLNGDQALLSTPALEVLLKWRMPADLVRARPFGSSGRLVWGRRF